MKEKWFVTTKKADFDAWAKEFGISPVIARLIRNRDLTTPEEVRKYLYGGLDDCYSPWALKDMDKAVDAVEEALKEENAVRVIGDYDVDGICASYILTSGLRYFGLHVDTAIPHRIHDGYGLNDQLIREAKADGIDMILTCDNGISAASQIRLAGELGMKVIVTDHHEVPYVTDENGRRECIPPALAVVDPKREEDTYPFPGICGAVVVYKLILALAERLGKGNPPEELLEFAAFATVCDVMELKDENRILVKEGLKRLKKTENPGLKALIEVCGIERDKLSAYHLGFVLGPCLNATGRLDTAQRALELLQCRDERLVVATARELKELNDSRKNLTLEGVEKALAMIREKRMEQDKVLVIYLPEVHESLAGIVAGRVREQYYRPVFVLTRGEDGVKGSGRSIEAYHMYEAMTEVGHLFTKYGGHKMAAGLSMEEKNVELLRKELNDRCRLTEDDFIPKVSIDVPMPLSYAGLELATQLELLEPFGVGNPKPLFAQKNLRFLAARRIGKTGQYAKITALTPEGRKENLMLFGNPDQLIACLDEKYGAGSGDSLFSGKGDYDMSVVYQLGTNSYQGRDEVQFLIQYYS